jgi:hypothetical protein
LVLGQFCFRDCDDGRAAGWARDAKFAAGTNTRSGRTCNALSSEVPTVLMGTHRGCCDYQAVLKHRIAEAYVDSSDHFTYVSWLATRDGVFHHDTNTGRPKVCLWIISLTSHCSTCRPQAQAKRSAIPREGSKSNVDDAQRH